VPELKQGFSDQQTAAKELKNDHIAYGLFRQT
jgi:hypothetical protein